MKKNPTRKEIIFSTKKCMRQRVDNFSQHTVHTHSTYAQYNEVQNRFIPSFI